MSGEHKDSGPNDGADPHRGEPERTHRTLEAVAFVLALRQNRINRWFSFRCGAGAETSGVINISGRSAPLPLAVWPGVVANLSVIFPQFGGAPALFR
jgi:hypothetical protein